MKTCFSSAEEALLEANLLLWSPPTQPARTARLFLGCGNISTFPVTSESSPKSGPEPNAEQLLSESG